MSAQSGRAGLANELATTRPDRDRALAALDENHVDRGDTLAATLAVAGRLARSEGRSDEAIELFGHALEAAEPGSDERGVALTNLGNTYFQRQEWGEAERRFRESWEIFQATRPPGHVRRAHAADNLAAAIASQGRLEEAAPLFQTALEVNRVAFDEGRPQIGQSALALGDIELRLGDRAAAQQHFAEALKIFEAAGDTAAEDLDQARARLAALGPTS